MRLPVSKARDGKKKGHAGLSHRNDLAAVVSLTEVRASGANTIAALQCFVNRRRMTRKLERARGLYFFLKDEAS